MGHQVVDGGRIDRTAVLNNHIGITNPATNQATDAIGLFRGTAFAGADRPDGLVGHDQTVGSDALKALLHLTMDDALGFPGLPLIEAFANTENRDQAINLGGPGPQVDLLVGFAVVLAGFAVADDGVGDAVL